MPLSLTALSRLAAANSRPGANLRPRAALRFLALAAFAIASASCMETHACTEIGCSDGLSIELRTPTGSWTDGIYEVALRADDKLASCTLRIPEQLPDPPGKVVDTSCGNGVRLNLSSVTQCEMGCDSKACWQKCTPIPGQFESHLAVTGTPARIGLTVVRDGATLLAEEVEPAYRDAYPNGPECGGACKQATLEYTVP
jgi:hypothetical protein